MARDVQDTVRHVLHALDGAGGNSRGKSNNGLSGAKGVAAGAGAAALVPLAVKGAGRLVKGISADGLGDVVHAPQHALHGATSKLGDSVGGKLSDKVSQKVDEAGGAKGIAKDTLKDALPFGGGGGGKSGGKGGAPGVGKGRRMPVQQSVDIGVDIETVYNQFTQFEEWPNFMHRVTRVTQDEPTTVKFAAKIWAKTKEFTAEIETQRPDERIKWSVTEGLTHTGVVTFHELGPHLTRILLTMDVEPGGLLEKAARGMRHIKRAARADLHRFKAFIEMTEQETGAWRGVIEDGEVVEEHDPKYDRTRDYADLDELLGDQQDDDNKDDEKDEEKPAQRGRSGSRSSGSRGGSGSRSTSARSTSSRSTSSRSSGSRSSGSRSSGSRSGGSGSGGSRTRNHSGSSSRSQATASRGQTRRRQSGSRNGHSE